MKKIINYLIIIFFLSSCENVEYSNSLNQQTINNEFSEIIKLKDDISKEHDENKKTMLISYLEYLLLESGLIKPISKPYTNLNTRLFNDFDNNYQYKGNSYYKIKDCIAFSDKLSMEEYYNLANGCKLTKDIKDTLNMYYNNDTIESLDYNTTNNKISNTVLIQCNDSLLKYDNNGNVVSDLCESYYVSDDKLKYTFILKDDIYFINNKGEKVALIKATDFKTGFIHMLDTNKFTNLFNDVKGVKEYLENKINYDEIGFKVINDKTLTIELENENSMFLSMLANCNFSPINYDFFKSKKGELGIDEFSRVRKLRSYSYGLVNDPSSILYTGAYYIDNIIDNKITLNKNNNHYDKDNVKIKKITFTLDNSDLYSLNEKFNDFVYDEVITNDIDEYSIEKTFESSISCAVFNIDRKNYQLDNSNIKTSKNEKEIEICQKATNNVNFRKAVLSAIDSSKLIRNDFSEKQCDRLSLFSHLLNKDSYDGFENFFKANTLSEEILNFYQTNYSSFTNDNLASYYYQKAYESDIELFSNNITLDVICYLKDTNQKQKIVSIKSQVEEKLSNVKINIIEVDNIYEYFLCGKEYYECYDLLLDYSIKCDYNDSFSYLNNLINDLLC